MNRLAEETDDEAREDTWISLGEAMQSVIEHMTEEYEAKQR